MMRRTIAVSAGLLALVLLALLPTTASAQYVPPATPVPTVSPEPPVTPTSEPGPPTSRPRPPVSPPASPASTVPPNVAPDEVENPQPQPQPEVKGDVVSRPLPRTGNDISGTAIFGGALTILGVAIALGARKRRNSFDGA